MRSTKQAKTTETKTKYPLLYDPEAERKRLKARLSDKRIRLVREGRKDAPVSIDMETLATRYAARQVRNAADKILDNDKAILAEVLEEHGIAADSKKADDILEAFAVRSLERNVTLELPALGPTQDDKHIGNH